MKTAHRYILEPYKGMKSRYICPACQRTDKTFSLYIDTDTGEHIAPSVGRCNRECNCGHHYTPKQYFQDNNISFDTPQPKAYKLKPVILPQKPVSFIPVEVFKASLKSHEANNFVKFLIDRFGIKVASELISRYFIATSKHWGGATVFWQIDLQGKIRTGKIMLYNPNTGKRVKEPFNHINWAHKTLEKKEFELKQCFFGEHLINQDKSKPIAIVESEKTAIIASIYLPQFIWLAVGSLNNLNAEKCFVLKGRNITLFPDLNCFEKWSKKANELLLNIKVSDLLERKANDAERKQGLDIADYLIRFNFKEFALSENLTKPDIPNKDESFSNFSFQQDQKLTNANIQSLKKEVSIPTYSKIEQNKTYESWDQNIVELEIYFKNIAVPNDPVWLSPWEKIIDFKSFINSHLNTAKANNGNPTFLPDLQRLQKLQQILINK